VLPDAARAEIRAAFARAGQTGKAGAAVLASA
jgi:hypothetical protein